VKPKNRKIAQSIAEARKAMATSSALLAKQRSGAAKAKGPSAKAKTPQRTRRAGRVKARAPKKVAKRRAAKAATKKFTIAKVVKAAQRALEKFKKMPPVVRVIARYKKIAQAITRRLDRLQARAPPRVAKLMAGIRTYSLTSMRLFVAQRIKRDPHFLGGFFAGLATVSYGVLPGALLLGMNPALAAGLDSLLTPVFLGVIAVRDLYLRRSAGENISLAQSSLGLFEEFRVFAKNRQANFSKVAAAAVHP